MGDEGFNDDSRSRVGDFAKTQAKPQTGKSAADFRSQRNLNSCRPPEVVTCRECKATCNERSCRLQRINGVAAFLPRPDELRTVIRRKGFSVKSLATSVGLDVRTLERHFRVRLHTTPKAWITSERMNRAQALLDEGLGNKQVAAMLGYTCASNFCRDFKRHFGCAPQQLTRLRSRL